MRAGRARHTRRLPARATRSPRALQRSIIFRHNSPTISCGAPYGTIIAAIVYRWRLLRARSGARLEEARRRWLFKMRAEFARSC